MPDGSRGSGSIARLCSVETSFIRSASLITPPSPALFFTALATAASSSLCLERPSATGSTGRDVGDVPVRAVADRLDGRLGGADELGDLAVGQLGVELDQPGDRRRAVLALGERGVARALALLLAVGGGVVEEPEVVGRVGLAALDLLGGELAVRDRVEALDALRHLAVGDAVDLELVQPGELGDLPEGQRGVLDQPDGGRLLHQWKRHGVAPFVEQAAPAAENSAAPRARGSVFVGNW